MEKALKTEDRRRREAVIDDPMFVLDVVDAAADLVHYGERVVYCQTEDDLRRVAAFFDKHLPENLEVVGFWAGGWLWKV